MPSGKTHERIGLITLAGAGAFTLLSPLVPTESKIPIVLGLVFGIILTPDVDLGQVHTHEEHRALKVPVFGKMWVMFWASYGELFNHRGISHAPIIGTLTRLFWLIKPFLRQAILLAFLVVSDIIVVVWVYEPGQFGLGWFPWFFLGWTFQDLIHEFADVLVSEHKQSIKERKL